MKTLILLYSDLLKIGKEKLYAQLEQNINLLQKVIGIDSIYASISSQFKDLFDKFPDVCFINNLKDTSVFGAYKGLRKLRGNNVLLIDGGVKLSRETIAKFLNRINVTVGIIKDRWSGIALINMRDLDYVIKSLEKNFERTLLDAFYTLRDTYSIIPDFIELKEELLLEEIVGGKLINGR